MTGTQRPAAGDTPGRPARPDLRRVTGALFVDFGDRERPPRARYQCLRCRTVEGPVTGAPLVAEFVSSVRAVHAARCTPQEPRT
ncbi:hypothetical protein [Streptomyces youssoufiensis]